jgi:hypothetical protein
MPQPPFPDPDPSDHRYGDVRTDLSDGVEEPRYRAILDWMEAAESKALAYDLWARGNYTRRIVHNRANDVSPVLVPFRYVDELRWAHRRLGLMGLDAEYIYTEPLGSTKKVLMLHPGGEYLIDSGWGYIAALGSTTQLRGRQWFPVMGFARPMPEAVLEWIIDEAASDFERGKVFVTPAELVGLSPAHFESGLEGLAEIQDGVPLSDSLKATELLASLDLPALEHLTSAQFNRLLVEHADDLVRFRHALRKLIRGEADVESAIDEVRAEVAEMRFADSQQRLRAAVSRFGGVFTTFAATVGAATTVAARQSPSEALLAATGAAVLAGASAALVDLWKQAADRRVKMRERKLSMFWKLGLQSPEAIRRKKTRLAFHKFARTSTPEQPDIPDCHWLCPPTNGMKFLAVRRNP